MRGDKRKYQRKMLCNQLQVRGWATAMDGGCVRFQLKRTCAWSQVQRKYSFALFGLVPFLQPHSQAMFKVVLCWGSYHCPTHLTPSLTTFKVLKHLWHTSLIVKFSNIWNLLFVVEVKQNKTKTNSDGVHMWGSEVDN